MKKCSICKKNIAVIFATQMENGKAEMKGLCIQCAKKLGIPIMDQLMQQTGMTEDDIENLAGEMENMFEDIEGDDGSDESPLINMIKKSFPMDGITNDPNDEQEIKNQAPVIKEEPKE